MKSLFYFAVVLVLVSSPVMADPTKAQGGPSSKDCVLTSLGQSETADPFLTSLGQSESTNPALTSLGQAESQDQLLTTLGQTESPTSTLGRSKSPWTRAIGPR